MKTPKPGSHADPRCQPLGPSLPALVFALMTVPVVLAAQTLTLTLETVAGGITLTGSGTPTAGLDFGTVSKFGSIGANITRTLGPSDYSVDTLVGVKVTKTGPTTDYTLQARLSAASVYGWEVQGVSMTTSYADVGNFLAYGSTFSYVLKLVIPDAQTTGLSIVQDVEFLAIAN